MDSIQEKSLGGITSLVKSKTGYSIRYETGEHATLSILNNHVFRYYMSPTGLFLDYPIPVIDTETGKMNSKTVEDYGTDAFDHSGLDNTKHHYVVQTNKLKIQFSKLDGTFAVYDKRTGLEVLKEHKPICYSDSRCTQKLNQKHDEYFYGCGIQYGVYTHKFEKICIDYKNQQDNGSVPKPFYWSTKGYGVMRNTWKIGCYDFGSKDHQIIETAHDEDYFDAFYFINSHPEDILNDYYELTGSPILMPEYAFYNMYVNTFTKTYWYWSGQGDYRDMFCPNEDTYYAPYFLPIINGKEGIVGSLNGEKSLKTKYEFSARHIIDWFKSQDMPLGSIVPNNESGYSQTDSFSSDLENLKNFVEYANEKGVEVALWTGRCLEPIDPGNPQKGERDLARELDVGIVALKCDEEDIYHELSVVENASNIFMNHSKNNTRPLLLMRVGWAGSQRFVGFWIGEQTGSVWEYIQSHIPALIGAGLSGIPVVGSFVDGLYGGGDIEVNLREYQWKVFTPLHINIDVWGKVSKLPFAYNSIEFIELTRASLKLRSMLMPYNYTISHESIQGLPMIRAMFLEFPLEISSYTKDSQYQFMWGPSLLIAPVYENSDPNCAPEFVNSSSFYWAGNDFYYTKPTFEKTTSRNGIFLPDSGQVWIDLFTGNKYQGGKIYNNIKAPLWKIPVFVKDGAIIPLVNANNNPKEIKRDCRIFLIYPNGATSFKVYEDDGTSTGYLEGKYAETTVNVNGPLSNESGNVSIYIGKTTGNYKDLVEERSTVLQIMASKHVENVQVYVGDNEIEIEEVDTKKELEDCDNVYYYDDNFMVNPYLKVFGTDELHQKCLCIIIEKINVTDTEIKIKLQGFTNKGNVFGSTSIVNNAMEIPQLQEPKDNDTTATTITLHWKQIETSYYEIEKDGNTVFSNIIENKVMFKDFAPKSQHFFRIRSVSDAGVSLWSDSIEIETKVAKSYAAVVEGVTMSCNLQSEHGFFECNLMKPDDTLWHTDIDANRTLYADSENISLSFDLKDVHKIKKIEYLPREYAGGGTFLKVQYRHSIDRENWTVMSSVISWDCNDSVKIIEMGEGVKFQYFELDVLESVTGFGSGRSFLFYKKI